MPALPRVLTALVAALVLGLVGCGRSPAASSHNDADVTFASSMLPHHQQAVEMSDLLLAKDGVAADVVRLATSIKEEQAPEIVEMTGWLTAWDAPPPSTGSMEGMGAHDGMMDDADMRALEVATGKDARTLFLRGMVRHHQGAIAMARTEVEQGQDGAAKGLAASIVTSQQAEITRMNALLAG